MIAWVDWILLLIMVIILIIGVLKWESAIDRAGERHALLLIWCSALAIILQTIKIFLR